MADPLDHAPHFVGLRGMGRTRSVNGGDALRPPAVVRGAIWQPAAHSE